MFTKLLKNNTPININHAQGKILFILSKKNEMSINELCKELSLSKQSLTSMLDRLHAGGYITKRISEFDKRITLVSITDKSTLEVQIYEDIVSQMSQIYYNDFTEKEINEFESYLKRVYKNLENIDNRGN